MGIEMRDVYRVAFNYFIYGTMMIGAVKALDDRENLIKREAQDIEARETIKYDVGADVGR